MKHTRKYLSIILVAVMIISALSLVACNPQSNDKDQEIKNESVSISKFSLTPQSTQFISLSASAPTRSATNANVIEHTLTATVLPESAENKAVDWSVAWAQTAITYDVEDYVTVTPQSDGSNVATVTCLQPFAGNIIITVTTREGGFTAQCVCKYVGLPSQMVVDLSEATIVTDTRWNVDVVEVGDASENYYAIELSNIFGEVGEDFTPEYDISVQAFGRITTSNVIYDANGQVTDVQAGTVELQAFDLMETAGYCYAYFLGKGMYNFVNVRISNGQLYVIGQQYPEAYVSQKTNADGTSVKSVFSSYTDGKEPYVQVTLTEKTTGITYTFNVRTVGTVNEVTLDNNELIF